MRHGQFISSSAAVLKRVAVDNCGVGGRIVVGQSCSLCHQGQTSLTAPHQTPSHFSEKKEPLNIHDEKNRPRLSDSKKGRKETFGKLSLQSQACIQSPASTASRVERMGKDYETSINMQEPTDSKEQIKLPDVPDAPKQDILFVFDHQTYYPTAKFPRLQFSLAQLTAASTTVSFEKPRWADPPHDDSAGLESNPTSLHDCGASPGKTEEHFVRHRKDGQTSGCTIGFVDKTGEVPGMVDIRSAVGLGDGGGYSYYHRHRQPLLRNGHKLRAAQIALVQRQFCQTTANAARKGSSSSGGKGSLMDPDDIDKRLRKEEKHVDINQGAISYYETNRLASNAPCEDQHSEGRCGPSQSFLFGVFDGHGGGACSETVSQRLFDYCCVALTLRQMHQVIHHKKQIALEWLTTSCGQLMPGNFFEAHQRNLEAFMKRFKAEVKSEDQMTKGKQTVRQALQIAFDALDEDISNEAHPSVQGGRLSLPHVRIAASGSCACVAHVRGPHLHIANVGDSAAVLAVRADDGSWTARQLSREHCFDNPQEVQRIRSEHPMAELDTVLRGGRLLGELMPLRAFGDVRYKWSRDKQNQILGHFLGPNAAPALLQTPPYLKAIPEVYYHRLTVHDKFLVIGTDGLWDFLSPDRVVRLVADHLKGKDTLYPYEPTAGETTIDEALTRLSRRKAGEAMKPADENGATHLIRVALGGNRKRDQQEQLSAMLSLPPGISRNYRDDVTVQIIHFNSDYLNTRWD